MKTFTTLSSLLCVALLFAGSAKAATTAVLNDAQIAQVLTSLNNADIDINTLSKKISKTPSVTAINDQLINAHTQSNTTVSSWATQFGIAQAQSDVSLQITANSVLTHASLAAMTDHAFDVAYIKAEIEFQQNAIDTFDKTLIPAAQNDQLKIILMSNEIMAKVELLEAQAIQRMIGN